MSVGNRIKQARENKKLTQEELGRLCGTTKQNIFKYENAIITNIPFDRLELIAKVLDISPAYLMGWEKHPGSEESRDDLSELIRLYRKLSLKNQKVLISMAQVLSDQEEKQG